MEKVPQAFFGAIKHEHKDEVVDILKQYDIGLFIVSLEVSQDSHKATDGQHMHFYVEMSPQDYTRFAKRIFIDRFKLKGKATKGESRQYGKVQKIENVQRMKAYTVKDGNIVTNMSEGELELLKNISFKKQDKEDEFEKLMEEMTRILGGIEHPEWNLNLADARRVICMFYMANPKSRKDLSKANVERISRLWICYHSPWIFYVKYQIMDRMFYSSPFV